MYKLAGLDAGFLYNETRCAPQHIASVQILEPPAGTAVDEFVIRLKALLQSRAHLAPYLTSKLQRTPFELDHPVWVRDPDFNIDNHVLTAEVSAPGGRAELEATIAELHARPLDRSKPLWELWVLSGLEGGRIAYYNRVHHACLDGISGQAALATVMDTTVEPRAEEPAPAAFTQRPSRRSAFEMLAEAVENFARYQVRQTSRLLDQLETARRVWQRTLDPSKGLGAAGQSAPRTRFNRSVEAARSFATAELPLADLRRIGKATGTTLNDVVLAICSGGLAHYFDRLQESPREDLIAGCPVSLRKPGDTTTNNQVTMMMVSLASRESDPVKRLLEIGRSSQQAKGLIADIADSYEADVALPGLPVVTSAAMRMLEMSNAADILPVRLPCNLIVSNVPGPREQLYSLGARVLTHYPVSIPVHGLAVNVTVQSYLDQMFLGITACARALPDPGVLRDDMLAAFAELKDRALKPASAATPRERTGEARPKPVDRPAAVDHEASRAA